MNSVQTTETKSVVRELTSLRTTKRSQDRERHGCRCCRCCRCGRRPRGR